MIQPIISAHALTHSRTHALAHSRTVPFLSPFSMEERLTQATRIFLAKQLKCQLLLGAKRSINAMPLKLMWLWVPELFAKCRVGGHY